MKAGLLLLVLLVVAFASGCQVHTDIDVDTAANGTGTVTVTVTLDKAATEAVGDLQGELQTSDLTAAGWQVSGPTPGPGGSTIIRATQAFSSLSDASTLVAEIAGTGGSSDRPFRLQLTHRTNFWSSSNQLSGHANLSCDLACFGESGLAHALGRSTGVDPGSVASQRKNFTFAMTVTLPGTLRSSNASTVAGHRLTWTPRLGHDTVLSATTSDRNTTHVYGAVAAAAVVALLVLLGIVTFVWRRIRRRRRPDPWGDYWEGRS